EGECGFSCPMMLAGGVSRFVGPHARVTIRSLGLERLVAEYLDEMGYDRMLLAMIQRVVPPGYRQLDSDRMRIFELTTGPAAADALTAPVICNAAPQPKNCRRVAATE